MKLSDFTKVLNDHVDAGHGDCDLSIMVLKPSPVAENPPYVEDYDIGYILDHTENAPHLTIVARGYEELPKIITEWVL